MASVKVAQDGFGGIILAGRKGSIQAGRQHLMMAAVLLTGGRAVLYSARKKRHWFGRQRVRTPR